ncbi:MAG: type II secretion system F family protein [Firmicutes bacterium]|jgi:tight adherence protein B|nr:type II secretion system F family protein [Bacillota bacterium]
MNLNLMAGFVFASVLSLFMGIATVRRKGADKIRAAVRPTIDDFLAEDKSLQVKTKRLSYVKSLESEALKAGLNIKGSHFIVVALLAGSGAFLLALGLTGDWRIAVWATLAGALAPRWWLALQKRRRADAFIKQLDGALGVAVSALRAGASLAQAITQVAEAGIDPVSEEFERVDKAVKLGLTPMEAIQRIRDRVDCPDLDLVVVGTQIMTRTGGNLVQVYENAAEMVRERRAFRESMRAYTAQPRLSAAIVSLVPITMTLLVRALNPNYFAPMWRTAGGKAILIMCFMSIVVGWFVVQRAVSVEVS